MGGKRDRWEEEQVGKRIARKKDRWSWLEGHRGIM